LIGGLVVGAAAGFALAHLLLGLPRAEAVIATGIALVAGIVGDLSTSVLKRWRGKKDFSPVLKRHGGLLDIYDSLLFAAPAICLWRLLA
jgi:phosphatidate cytidylyltransferase